MNFSTNHRASKVAFSNEILDQLPLNIKNMAKVKLYYTTENYASPIDITVCDFWAAFIDPFIFI